MSVIVDSATVLDAFVRLEELALAALVRERGPQDSASVKLLEVEGVTYWSQGSRYYGVLHRSRERITVCHVPPAQWSFLLGIGGELLHQSGTCAALLSALEECNLSVTDIHQLVRDNDMSARILVTALSEKLFDDFCAFAEITNVTSAIEQLAVNIALHVSGKSTKSKSPFLHEGRFWCFPLTNLHEAWDSRTEATGILTFELALPSDEAILAGQGHGGYLVPCQEDVTRYTEWLSLTGLDVDQQISACVFQGDPVLHLVWGATPVEESRRLWRNSVYKRVQTMERDNHTNDRHEPETSDADWQKRFEELPAIRELYGERARYGLKRLRELKGDISDEVITRGWQGVFGREELPRWLA